MKLPAKLTFRIFLQILIRRGFWLALLLLISDALDRFFLSNMQAELSSQQGATWFLWVWALGSLTIGITTPLFFILLVFSSFQEHSRDFLSPFKQALIENMRATGKSLWAGLLLILPGVYLFFQYLFVPFVVCFDPAYQRGEKDALQTARQVAKPGTTLLVLLSYLILIGLGSMLTDPLRSPLFQWDHLPQEFFATVIETFVQILFVFVLIGFYKKSESRGIA